MIEIEIKCDGCKKDINPDRMGERVYCQDCYEASDNEKEEYLDEVKDMHRKIEGLEYENGELKKEIEELKEAKK